MTMSHPPAPDGNAAPRTDIGIEDRYQMLIEAVRDYAIFMLDAQGRVASWNDGAQRIKGYSPDEIVGRHFSVFYTQEDVDADKPARELREAAAQGRVEDEGWRVRRDGSRFWANVVISAVRDASGTLLGYAKVTRDLTERKRLASLEHANEVSTQMQVARENEQKRIARELHDDLGQQLTALKMGMALLEAQVRSAGWQEPLHATHELQAQVDAMAVSLRRIAADLRPPLLDDLGLSAALEWLVEDFSRRYGVAGHLHMSGEEDAPIDEFAATTIFRIVQEALTNVARHAQAHTVSVGFMRNANLSMIDITDDGVGAPANPQPSSGQRSFGLMGMRERVRQLHGTIEFHTAAGAGFHIRIQIPEPRLRQHAAQ
jgi:PAS domain S-box-containing protein